MRPALRLQSGLTLVELLVAMAIGMVISIVALTTLLLGRTECHISSREYFAVALTAK